MDAIERYDRQLTEYARSRLSGVPGLRAIGAAVGSEAPPEADRVGVLSFVLDGFTPAVGQSVFWKETRKHKKLGSSV